MSFLRRAEIRIILVALLTLLVIVDFFVAQKTFNTGISNLLKWSVIIAGWTLILGAVNIGIVHGRHLMRRTPGQWSYSVWLLFCVVITFVLAAASVNIGLAKEAYDYLILNIHTPLTSAAYGIIGFYFASCIFRAFRGRNSYVIVFLFAGCVSLLYNAPVVDLIPGAPGLGKWFTDVPNVAGTRGIIIAAAVGVIAGGLRALLGMERGGIMAEER